jgi:hypothetical protein
MTPAGDLPPPVPALGSARPAAPRHRIPGNPRPGMPVIAKDPGIAKIPVRYHALDPSQCQNLRETFAITRRGAAG